MSNIRPGGRLASCAEKRNEKNNHIRGLPVAPPEENLLEVFDRDDELLEPEPEYGDFWEEWDDDCVNDR